MNCMVDLSRFFVAVALYLVGLILCLRIARGRFGTRRMIRLAGWIGVALGPLLFCWGLSEPYFPQVTIHRIESPLIRSSRPVRIVHLSDLHTDGVRLEERLPELVAQLSPDLVVFTGDAINSGDGLPLFQRTMSQLARQFPTFAVRGNWDVWWFDNTDLYSGTGVHLLDGKGESLDVRGTRLWIAGTAVDNEALIEPAIRRAPRGSFRILAHHYPGSVELARQAGADLVLSGDTHGGQIVLPILGPLVRIRRLGQPFIEAGLHQRGETFLYVNRGLGMEGHGVPPVRIGCRPEIAALDLVAHTP
jgi:hypothetical protein